MCRAAAFVMAGVGGETRPKEEGGVAAGELFVS
jgi:hypothetical protein